MKFADRPGKMRSSPIRLNIVAEREYVVEASASDRTNYAAEQREASRGGDIPRRLTPASSDEDLMAAYVRGDEDAFRWFFARYAPLLKSALQRGLFIPEEAQDLLQQTFLQIHRARKDFDPGQRVRPWIFTIAMNLKREYFRRKKRRPEFPLERAGIGELGATSQAAERVDAGRTLAFALGRLPADQREVIELFWFDGLGFSEVAKVMGKSLSAVKVRAHRGYAKLRAAINDDEGPTLLIAPELRRGER